MILKWLQSVIGFKNPASQNGHKPEPKTPLIDIAHEVLAREAQAKQQALKEMERYGTPFVERQKWKEGLRRKVKKLMQLPISDDEGFDLVEEVTEKFAEAAEADPYYRRLFGPTEKNR